MYAAGFVVKPTAIHATRSYGIVNSTAMATPSLNAALVGLVVICAANSIPWVTAKLPLPVATQLGVSASLGPTIVADIPVSVGVSNPHVLT